MSTLDYTLDPDDPGVAPLGLIVLQTDETIESEFALYFSDSGFAIHVSRIPSGAHVTTDSLAEMESALPAAADLLPKARPYRAVGYGCTSASSVIGSERVEELVQRSCKVETVTNPLRAAVARADSLGISRLALLSPYIEEVNYPLRQAFARNGLSTDVFGTFGEGDDAKVARISVGSIIAAASELGLDPSVEAVFISCTNLRTYTAIPRIRERVGKPVLSSNQCLAWHMRHLNTA